MLARNRNVAVVQPDPLGSIAVMRPNHLHAPMNNPAFRRALRAVLAELSAPTSPR